VSFLIIVEGEGKLYFGSAAHGCKRSVDVRTRSVDRRLETGSDVVEVRCEVFRERIECE
jgi:hypothetical protein